MRIIMDGLAPAMRRSNRRTMSKRCRLCLLLRTQALIEKDPKKQQELIKRGTALSDKANSMQGEAERLAGVAIAIENRPVPPRADRPLFFTRASRGREIISARFFRSPHENVFD
jgi:hypothetical protein